MDNMEFLHRVKNFVVKLTLWFYLIIHMRIQVWISIKNIDIIGGDAKSSAAQHWVPITLHLAYMEWVKWVLGGEKFERQLCIPYPYLFRVK